MKGDWRDDIVEIIEVFKGDEEITVKALYEKADFKISKEELLEILIMGVQAGYIECVQDTDKIRYCTTSKGREYASLWYL